MPGHDGIWLVHELQRQHPQTAVVLATAYNELLDAETVQPEVADLLIKPFQRDRFELAVDRGRQWRKEALEELRWHAQLGLELTDGVNSVITDLQTRALDGTDEAEALLAIGLERVPHTMAHAERVTRYAVSVAAELGLAPDEVTLLELSARFHDIGKAPMPLALLTKPSPLTPGEVAVMRRHAEAGGEILRATCTLSHLAPVVVASHEAFGGGGYPSQLSGDAIPLASRIISVADTYDAMTQTRFYRQRLSSADAVSELLRCSPSQFDPVIVDAFVGVLGRH
ncbi:MAG TPA: HD domain-containing phosphohydrolase [Vicinamibacterales bacterium]|nr:HD domain-containing phosphohydrolase [Vicinamibacterales bacterium]